MDSESCTLLKKLLRLPVKLLNTSKRKNTNIPYITHPVAVGMILLKVGYSEVIITAGILHDTVEDPYLSLDDIERMFGPENSRNSGRLL